MLSAISRGQNFGTFIKATSQAVGTRVIGSPVTSSHDDHSYVPLNPKAYQVSGFTGESLASRMKATSASVNAVGQIRFAHSDLKIPSFDEYRRNDTLDPNSSARNTTAARKGFTYLMLTGFGVTSAVLTKATIRGVVLSVSPAKDLLALGKIEIDLNTVPEGKTIVFKWRGQPLFVKHRTSAEIADARSVDVASLRDPEHDDVRVKDPKYLILIGICTHLGCIPVAGQGDYFGGFYCPCHGSHYDSSGRIRKGPAPLNLAVPNYTMDGNLLVVG